jgi:hypothetical protein
LDKTPLSVEILPFPVFKSPCHCAEALRCMTVSLVQVWFCCFVAEIPWPKLFMDGLNEGQRGSLTPSVPLSARDSSVSAITVGGKGEETWCSVPRVEEVASRELFYPGLFI